MAGVALMAQTLGSVAMPVKHCALGAQGQEKQCCASSAISLIRSCSNAPHTNCRRVTCRHARCSFLSSHQSAFNGGHLCIRKVRASSVRRCTVMMASDGSEASGDPPLLSGKMAEFVSRTRRPGATSGNSEVENAYKLREAIKQTRERILANRQLNARQAAAAESNFKSTRTTPGSATSKTSTFDRLKTVAEAMSKSESQSRRPAAKKVDPVETLRPKASSTVKPEPVKPEVNRSSTKAEPAKAKAKPTPAPKTSRAKASRGRAASKTAEPEVPRTFVSGPDGVVAVLSVAPAGASEESKQAGAEKKAPVKADRRKGAKRKTKAPAGTESEGEGEESKVQLNGKDIEAESVSKKLNGGAKIGESSQNGQGRGEEMGAASIAGEPTLATAALDLSVGASYTQSPATVVTAELGSGGGLGASTSVMERTDVEEVNSKEGTAKPRAGVVNGVESSKAGSSEGAAVGSSQTIDSQSSSRKEGTPQTGSDTDVRKPKAQNGKGAQSNTPPAEEPKESAPSALGKNKYASKKSEPKKDLKDKLASFRGGSLVDRVLAAPKVAPILGTANLDTQGMVRLLRDLSTKEGAAKKPGVTAKTFSWLRKNKSPLDQVVYLAAIESFAREGNHTAAQEVIDDMKEHKVSRTPEHIANLITAYRVARRFREAAEIIMTSLDEGDVTLDATSFNGALRACVEGGLGAEKLLEVYSAMQTANVLETGETYAYVIDQCLLAKKDMPAAGWVAERMREKDFNLDKLGARVVERLLDKGRVEEAWERFINWKPAKGRWSATLYSRMLEGLISKDLAQDVSLHVSEMQRYKISIPPELWEKVTKIANVFGLQASTSEPAPAQSANTPAAGTDSESGSSKAATPTREVQTLSAKDIQLKGPLHALSESLVKRTAFAPPEMSEKTDKAVAREDKAPTMKMVWTPRGTFFTAPRAPRQEGAAESSAPGVPSSTVSQIKVAGQGAASTSVPQARAAQGGPSNSASRGGVSEGKSQEAASKGDVSAELEPYWKLIQVQISKGRMRGAAETLEDVLQLGLVPTADMYKELIVACSKNGLKDTAWSLIRQMQESGHIPTPDLFEALR